MHENGKDMANSKSGYILDKVEEWKGSGLTIKEFANRNSISKSTFGYWVRKNRQSSGPQTVSFIELAPAVNPKEIIEDASKLSGPATPHGSIVITFPSGLTVKIYG